MAAALNLRRAGPGDADAIRALTREAYAKWVPLIGREPRPMRADFNQAVRDHLIDLHEEAGVLVGLIEMIPQPDHLLIKNLAVREGRQGGGVGAKLLQHSETIAAGLGLRELRLYTNAAFAGNIAFYLRRGFVETSRERLSHGGTVVHFAKAVG